LPGSHGGIKTKAIEALYCDMQAVTTMVECIGVMRNAGYLTSARSRKKGAKRKYIRATITFVEWMCNFEIHESKSANSFCTTMVVTFPYVPIITPSCDGVKANGSRTERG
jgi:hypothetical protein